MKRNLLFILLGLMNLCAFGQNGKNYIKPINKDGFAVDSILSLKGNIISYLNAGTEFDMEKSQIEYIEHSILGRIDIAANIKPDTTAPSIPEPEFNGEAFICNFEDNTYIKMEKAIGQVKVKDQLMGPEKKLYVKPAKSPVRIAPGDIKVIVRVPNTNDDPLSFVRVSKFAASVTRKLSLARQNEITGKITYGGRDKQDIAFDAKKYGESSFLISFNISEAGEYCISISNSNQIDEKQSVSCFGVDY